MILSHNLQLCYRRIQNNVTSTAVLLKSTDLDKNDSLNLTHGYKSPIYATDILTPLSPNEEFKLTSNMRTLPLCFTIHGDVVLILESKNKTAGINFLPKDIEASVEKKCLFLTSGRIVSFTGKLEFAPLEFYVILQNHR